MQKEPSPDRWFFDLWSRFYDATLVQRLTYRPVHQAVLRELGRKSRQRIFDVGCGTGLLTARIHLEAHARRAVGCDFSHGMLRRAARNSPGLPRVCGDALRLPFRDGCFEAIVSTEAFHWFPDPDAALCEFFRVLSPGGRLLLALVNPRTEWLSRFAGFGSRLVGEPFSWPTRERLRARVRAAGFRLEAQRTVFRLPAPLLLPCVLTIATRPR